MALAGALETRAVVAEPGVAGRVLLFCIGRHNHCSARMPKALKQAGFAVSGLSPPNSFLTKTRYLDRHVSLPNRVRAPSILASLERACRDIAPGIIVPIDERAIAVISHLVSRERARRGTMSPRLLACLTRSLGRLDTLDTRISKSGIQQLARSLGLRTPEEITVGSLPDAIAAAAGFGYPVVLKASHGSGGAGVRICHDRLALERGFGDLHRRRSAVRRRIERMLGADWYWAGTTISVQRYIAGRPAMTTAAAVSGRAMAILSGHADETTSASGPARIVRLARHSGMEAASRSLIAALGATGFISFDFIVDANGREYLLECNSRPIRMLPLGRLVGLDLAAALARGLAGDGPLIPESLGHETATVGLFLPNQSWQASGREPIVSDTPWDDPELLKALLGQHRHRRRWLGRSGEWRRLFRPA